MILSLLLAAAAGAAEPPAACRTAPPALERPSLSVAWVARASRRVGAGGTLAVVPTSTLRAWMQTESADATRVLQGLGLRRASRPPRRPWVVTVFEVQAHELCRPIDPERAVDTAGVPVCERGDRGVSASHDGCGLLVDRLHSAPGLPVYAIPWREAAARGFCVLPLERFIRGE